MPACVCGESSVGYISSIIRTMNQDPHRMSKIARLEYPKNLGRQPVDGTQIVPPPWSTSLKAAFTLACSSNLEQNTMVHESTSNGNADAVSMAPVAICDLTVGDAARNATVLYAPECRGSMGTIRTGGATDQPSCYVAPWYRARNPADQGVYALRRLYSIAYT
nr:hypothetical protein CFP56_10362 [Quercus suber]